ncbi:MAG: hypothetical protein SOX36_04560 [Candidatus Cryptobacteroides sp.]|nr:hypothetical protein [Candidatus Cryptobacteroides sp.]
MEGSGTINLRTLTMEELAGVVNLYPWFAAARKELCVRMSALGGESWGVGQYADQAMYVADRSIISGIMRSSAVKDYSDSDLETLLSSYMEESRSGDAAEPDAQPARAARPVPGGDFFSKDEYDKVRRAGDNFTFRAPDRREFASGNAEDSLSLEFCTETLAEIYAEQGYFEQSKSIYRKLLLAFPEKSAYFASLIEKLDKLINNQNL